MALDKLSKQLGRTLTEKGFQELTPVQSQSIPIVKSGKDLWVNAPDQAGKTTAIVISTLQKLSHAVGDVPRAIIIVKDKAACLDLADQFELLSSHTDLRCFCAYDEGNIEYQRDFIYDGVDIIIGTIRRVNKLYLSSGIAVKKLSLFAIDDAEQLIKERQQNLVERLDESLPKCQKMLFSAESSGKLDKLVSRFLHFPEKIEA